MLEIVPFESDKGYLESSGLFNKDDIITASLLFSIGKIKGIKNEVGRSVCGINIPNLQELKSLKEKAKSYKSIRIWYSSIDSEDVSTLYFVINYLSDIENIYICDTNPSLFSHSTQEISKLLEKTKKLTKEEIENYEKLWDKLEEENGDLRLLNNSHLESKSYEYLDNKIIEYLKQYSSIRYGHFIINECMKLFNLKFDLLFKVRIDKMIEDKKIEIVNQENDSIKSDYEKYIKVSEK